MSSDDRSRATILVVDDTETSIDTVLKILDDYDLIAATSGADALQIVADEPVDLVLLDIVMPDMSGFEVCRKLKENPASRAVPVIFITARDDEQSVDTAYQVGGHDYIAKPFKRSELRARVATLLSLQRQFHQLQRQNEVLDRARRDMEALNQLHKNTLLTLSKNESRLREAQSVAQIGSWELDYANDKLIWSDEVYRIFAREPANFTPSYADFLAAVHPDDRERVDACLQRSLTEQTPYEISHRLLAADRVRFVHERGHTEFSADGKPARTLGTVQDITDLRLTQAHRNRLSRLLEQSSDSIFVIEAGSGAITEVNEAACRQLGYQRRELLQRHIWDLSTRITDQASWREALPGYLTNQHKTFETHNRHRDGHLVPVEINAAFIDEPDGSFFIAIARDISERQRAEQALQESSENYQAVLQGTKDGFWLVDLEGRIREVNDAYCHYSGYSRDELLNMSVYDLDTEYSPDMVHQRIGELAREGGAIFESRHRRKDGSTWPVEVAISYSPTHGGRMFSFFRNITQRKLNEELTELRNQLTELILSESPQRIMQTALDAAERISHSRIGFFHFVEADQVTVSLQIWSSRTLSEMCYAKGEGLHYPIDEAGVWVDCIRQRQPVIHNDYNALPHRKGLPEGHAPLQRELTVPVFRDQQIVAVIGVGNKASDYDADDISVVSRVADMACDFIERQKAEQRIQFMAYNDILTGLPNRVLFADRLRQAISASHRSRQLLAICYLDLDGFKPVNDRFGHAAGDRLLMELAQRLHHELRESDTLARLGGDEFVILLDGLRSLYHGEEIIRRILGSVTVPFEIEQQRIHVSASIGVTLFPQDDGDADTLLRHADQAMYQAKENGKNTYSLYDPVQDHKLRSHRKTIDEFDRALQESQLVLHFQPRIDLRDGELASVEALVRWQHPSKGLLMPGAFLPVIDDTPLEIALDEWVMQAALEQHMQWRQQGLNLAVSVNLSPRHVQQAPFPQFLAKVLADYPEDIADYLELEILETATIGDTAQVAEVMNACAKLGVRFSLDDFGTGYSSLTYFHRLPISIVKIDQNFVRNMLAEAHDQDIVEGVVSLATALKRPVVAEGVECIEVGSILAQIGCRYAQGYAIARPMPADALLTWSQEWQQEQSWHQLLGDSIGPTPFHDLNVGLYSHQRWREQFSDCLRSGNHGDCPELDEHACQFNQWYRGMGLAHYGDRPQYAFLQARHKKIHDRAQELLTIAEQQGWKQAVAGLEEFHALGDELIALMIRMHGH
jgi:diguanylate cyclase (GGDEF)-like protein/PAS domain S-box-containing protein